MDKIFYGTTRQGQPVYQYTLQNQNGLIVKCINYGCRLTHLFMPNAKGETLDILLGYDSLEAYEADTSFQGAFVGRYANRIKGAQFNLHNETYTLTQNNGENYLHGSFHQKVFTAEELGDNSISFVYVSPSGEDGFPGEVWVSVTYTLTPQNELHIDYRARAEEATHINLTNHAYFNLAGPGTTIENHALILNSTSFLEAGPDLCPTGRTVDATGGVFDFTEEKEIGRDIGQNDPQLQTAGGYDHCFILNKPQQAALGLAGILQYGGRSLRVLTTQPAVQLYTGNSLDDTVGKNGVPLGHRGGVCLETQHYPCTPNFPNFPSTVLEKADKYHQITILQFHWK